MKTIHQMIKEDKYPTGMILTDRDGIKWEVVGYGIYFEGIDDDNLTVYSSALDEEKFISTGEIEALGGLYKEVA